MPTRITETNCLSLLTSSVHKPKTLKYAYKVSKGTRTTRTWNERSRRPKPPVLRENPTPLGLQSTLVEVATHGIQYAEQLTPTGWLQAGDWNGDGVWGYFGFRPNPAIPTGLYVNALRNKVKTGKGVNIMEDCAEAGEAVRLMSGIGGELVRGLRCLLALKRGDLVEAQKLRRKPLGLHDIANAHLAASWGLAPSIDMLGEVMVGMNQTLMSDALYWKRYGAKRRWAYDKEEIIGNYQYRNRVEYSESASVWVKFHPPGVREVQFGNLLELGWNLLTLSHVIDWFIPVGQALSALDAGCGVELVRGTVTYKKWTDQQVWPIPYPKVPGWHYFNKTIDRQRKSNREHWRTVLLALPPVTLPRWEPNPSVGKLLLLISVLIGLRHQHRDRHLPDDHARDKVSKKEMRVLAKLLAKQKSLMLSGKRPRPVRDPWGSNPI